MEMDGKFRPSLFKLVDSRYFHAYNEYNTLELQRDLYWFLPHLFLTIKCKWHNIAPPTMEGARYVRSFIIFVIKGGSEPNIGSFLLIQFLTGEDTVVKESR